MNIVFIDRQLSIKCLTDNIHRDCGTTNCVCACVTCKIKYNYLLYVYICFCIMFIIFYICFKIDRYTDNFLKKFLLTTLHFQSKVKLNVNINVIELTAIRFICGKFQRI